MSIDLEKAGAPELKAYARDELGLSLSLTMKPETMVMRIRDRIAELGKEPPVPSKADDQLPAVNGKRVIINISKTSEKGGGEPAIVGYNYKMYSIPRGRNIAVPPGVEFNLRKAMKSVYETDEDTGELVERETQSYPYQIISGHENRLDMEPVT